MPYSVTVEQDEAAMVRTEVEMVSGVVFAVLV